MPVVAFVAGERIVVGTDAGEWLALENVENAELRALLATGPFSAAVARGGEVIVASWEPRLLTLRGGAWAELAVAQPVLALAAVRQGLAIADVDGGLALLGEGARVPVQELAAATPIVELAPLGGGLAALVAGGALEVTPWPGEPGPLAAVDTGAIGRPHALLPGFTPGTALVAGVRGVGILSGPRIIAATAELPEKIRTAGVFHGRGRACACLVGDGGGAWIVDEGLGYAARVRLPGAGLVGVAAGAGAGDALLGWTADGALHAIQPDGATARLAAGEVVLALPDPARPRHGIAIHWSAAAGAHVTRGHVAWT